MINSICKLMITLMSFLFLINSCVSATNYYVKNGGNNNADGKSDATAWATITKVNSTKFDAGDVIHFKCGDTWRELLSIPSSGTSGAYIKFTNYGEGNKPRILGSNTTTWSNYSANVWVSDGTFADPYSIGMYGAEVFFENNDGTISWGVHKSGIESLTAEYNWTYSSNHIYICAATDPDSKFTSVEIPQRAYIIDLNDKNYLHIDGIDIFYCGESGITYHTYPMQMQTGLIIENMEIGYVSTKNSEAGYGIDATYSDQIVRHCEIHNCGRRAISHHLYGTYTSTNILIEDNYFHDGWHTTGPDFSVGSSSSSYYGSIDGVIIRRNKFYDPPTSSSYSHQIFLQNYLYSSLKAQLKNVYIYSNIFISPTGAGINMEGTQSVYIYNNTFYNHNNKGSYHVWVDNNNSSVKVKNNIFYTTLNSDYDGIGSGLFVRSGQDYKKVDADFNLYYRINRNLRIIEKESTGIYGMGDIAKIRSALGWETNSPTPANPMFTDAANGDFTLTSSSPAICKGVDLNLPMDFNGNPFKSSNPSIGACESCGNETPITSKRVIILCPNPAHEFLTILREGSVLEEQILKISNIAGETVFNGILEESISDKQFSLHFNPGVYIVQVFFKNLTINAQKLIVVY